LTLRCRDGLFLRVRFRQEQHGALRADLGAGSAVCAAFSEYVRETILELYGVVWASFHTGSAAGAAITIDLDHPINTSFHLHAAPKARTTNPITIY
jgi:hypothetical protein